MVDERLSDGKRIAQLLASELTGEGGDLASLSVTDADPEVEPRQDGALAFRVRDERDTDEHPDEVDPLAEVFVHPDRVRVEFLAAPDAAAEAAEAEGLRVRPTAVRPPRTIVFVEDGAQVKWVLPAFAAVARTDE